MKIKKTWTVYRITNIRNGFTYVGLTSTTIEKRLASHWYDRKLPPFRRQNNLYLDMWKQDRDSFSISSIISGLSDKKEAAFFEAFWTKIYMESGLSYNRQIGLSPTADNARVAPLRMSGWNNKPIRRIDSGEVFESVALAAASIGVRPQSIHWAIGHGTKSGGTKWEII